MLASGGNMFAVLGEADDGINHPSPSTSTRVTQDSKDGGKSAKGKKKKRRRDNDYRSVVEDNCKRIEQFTNAKDGAKNGNELFLGGNLNTLEKRLLGDFARGLGLNAVDGGPPKHTLRISKPADWAQRREKMEEDEKRARKARGGRAAKPFTAATLPVTLRNRFCIDFTVPMPVLESPYFEYFCSLYEPVLHSQTNLDLFLEAVNSQGSVAKWKNYTGELVQRIIDDVTGTEAYKTFAADNLSRFDIKDPAPERAATENLYKIENSGKYYVSLDFTSANFNALRYYDPRLVFETKNWVEFLSRYTSYQALLNSKRFRAAALGKINHQAQSKIYHALNHRIYTLLMSHNVVSPDQIACKYTDEIVIETTKSDYCALVAKLRQFLDEKASDIDFVRLEPFRLVRLGPATNNDTEMFVKEALSTEAEAEAEEAAGAGAPPASVTFKCVYTRKFALAFKYYFHQEINEMDRTYVDAEGRFHTMSEEELWRAWN